MAKVLGAPRILPSGKLPDDGDYVANTVLVHRKMASGDTNVDVWSKNMPFKARMIDGWVVQHGAGAASDKIKVQRGDGAASETFTDITNDIDVSGASNEDLTRFTQLDDAQWEVDIDESIRIVSTSGALVHVYILLAPDLSE